MSDILIGSPVLQCRHCLCGSEYIYGYEYTMCGCRCIQITTGLGLKGTSDLCEFTNLVKMICVSLIGKTQNLF